MTQNITNLKNELTGLITAANDLQKLEEARVTALGKKGRITDLMKSLGDMAPEDRKNFGAAVNALKDEVSSLIEKQESSLKKQAMAEKLIHETMDVTLPLRPETMGTIHPISQTMDELISIFANMGFELDEGPDIEDDWHNFTALNFPAGHPAREMHDTFYLPDDASEQDETKRKKLLRTHTSTVQIRHMMGKKPPFRMICMGRTYRSDYDMTHTPVFHQIEGLVIDKDINMGHLKGCLSDFLRSYFEVEVPIRMRPSFFPFTEPSAEVDIGCSRMNGELKIGGGDGWLEILGSGMVHPNVLKNCGINPNEYQGFAFGMGVERIAMLKYGIPDLRTFFESDIRWLDHYGFDPLDRPNRATGTKS